MKKIIRQPEYRYTCDVCGKEITENQILYDDLVTLQYSVHTGNGWDDWSESREKHAHKGCLCNQLPTRFFD